MIGVGEIAVIAIIGGIIFFGRDTVLNWAKTLGQVTKTYNKEVEKKK